MNFVHETLALRRVTVIAAVAVVVTASNAPAYMGPGAGGGSLPGIGVTGIVVGLLLVAVGIFVLSGVTAALYAVGRKIAGKLRGQARTAPQADAEARPAMSDVQV